MFSLITEQFRNYFSTPYEIGLSEQTRDNLNKCHLVTIKALFALSISKYYLKKYFLNTLLFTQYLKFNFTLFCDLENPISSISITKCNINKLFQEKIPTFIAKSQKRVKCITKKGEIYIAKSQKRVKCITKKGEVHHKKGLSASQKRVNDTSTHPILWCLQQTHIINTIGTIILFNNINTTTVANCCLNPFSIKGVRHV